MKSPESKRLRDDWSLMVAVVLFAAHLAWWAALTFTNAPDETKAIWGASYQTVALWGGICGLIIARSWGGMGSVMGRSVGAFALGLLLQNLGQSVFSYYNVIAHVEMPYPSLADLGYFGSIPCYIYGAIMLGKASGVNISLKSVSSRLQAVAIPLAMLGLSYYLFLRGYEFDWSAPLRIFLDFGYPFGQAIYVSVAMLVYLLSTKTLGGIMKDKVLLILSALVVQYAADYNFLSQAYAGTWGVSGYGDVIYLLAYFLLAIGLIRLKTEYIHPREKA
ncbi:hypothetical protein EPO34_02775 [Patescibacteria group bacterium]|nr:MAG: hypothetical protein EPO34_02775 [Patescibacteria group bacterium]